MATTMPRDRQHGQQQSNTAAIGSNGNTTNNSNDGSNSISIHFRTVCMSWCASHWMRISQTLEAHSLRRRLVRPEFSPNWLARSSHSLVIMAFRAAGAQLVVEDTRTAAETEVRSLFDEGAGLRAHILGLYRRGEMSAAAVCTLSYHACNAGARGVGDLALHPSSTHAAEHLRAAASARSQQSFYWFDLPMWVGDTNSRELIRFPINLPHDQFSRAFSDSPADWDPSPRGQRAGWCARARVRHRAGGGIWGRRGGEEPRALTSTRMLAPMLQL